MRTEYAFRVYSYVHVQFLFCCLLIGERIDFVLNADQAVNQYRIRFTSTDWCSSLNAESHAVLTYNTSVTPIKEVSPTPDKVLTTVESNKCGGADRQCLSDLKSLQKIPDKLTKEEIDFKLNFTLRKYNFSKEWEIENDADLGPVMTLNDIAFTFPPSPLLTQYDDIPDDQDMVCNEQKTPSTCSSQLSSCRCTHVVPVPLMASVQIVISNPGQESIDSDQNYVFHLHGQPFYVIYRGELDNATSMRMDVPSLTDTFQRNLNPVLKDTISVPNRSFVILRFIASNPGYWFLHESRPQLWSNGMAVVLKVGERDDFPPVPQTFPKCGNWIGPEFFLA